MSTTTPSQSSILCDVPPSLRMADHRLSEYGRWATTSSSRGGSEPTLERRFRRHLDKGESLVAFEARRVPANPLMAVQDALLCQRALSRVPDRERIVLSIIYVRSHWTPAHLLLRVLRIPPALCRVRHEAGLRMFDNLYALLSPLAWSAVRDDSHGPSLRASKVSDYNRAHST